MTIQIHTNSVTRGNSVLPVPDAILFDMDGVLADVSGSYRSCIQKTAERFGVVISGEDIARAKRRPGANNDWILSHRLLSERNVHVDLNSVIEVFQSFYLGPGEKNGLRETEKLLIQPPFLGQLASRYPLGIVTGRPREEAIHFLERFEIVSYFDALVCLEDAPSKPDPSGVHLAASKLEANTPWMVGDTPDDIIAAVAAEASAIGICGLDGISLKLALFEAGAKTVLNNVNDLEDLLP